MGKAYFLLQKAMKNNSYINCKHQNAINHVTQCQQIFSDTSDSEIPRVLDNQYKNMTTQEIVSMTMEKEEKSFKSLA